MLMIDAHLDLSWNALSYDRDQTLDLQALRKRDGLTLGNSRGKCTVSLPELKKANVGIALATLLARSRQDYIHPKTPERVALDFANQEIACSTAVGQMFYYTLLEQRGLMKKILTRGDLQSHWQAWEKSTPENRPPLGFILSMEGCDPIITPKQAQWWFDQGLRTACLSHYGPSAYSMGTGGDGHLTAAGKELAKEFSRIGMILDVVHTADTALLEAMEIYEKPVFISHGNCRAIVPGDRQISDEQIKLVAARGGVIGAVLDNWMLQPGYKPGATGREGVSLSNVADHIHHVCQITGSAKHAAIGSDLDGGFGTEQSPHDLDTINDLHKLEDLLAKRGYSQSDIALIMYGNWVRFFSENLPK